MVHVAQISFFFDRERRDPEVLLHDWPSLVDVAEATRTAARVTVIQAAVRDAHIARNGIDYHFVAPRDPLASIAGADTFIRLLDRLRPDVFHVHGLGFPAEVLALRRLAPRVPVLLQDHADRTPRIWRRLLWRRALAKVSGVAFCARSQARPFLKSHLLHASTPIFEIPESTSRFSPGDQVEARRRTGLHGAPCLLWVGHLDDNKDPLTVLDGVARAARQLPEMQLWCCFGTGPLLDAVRRRCEIDAVLRDRVHLLGRRPHAEIEHMMRAADLFVLGSHREGSGYSLIEALSCGLSPVVTDIPSFRALTASGSVGRLWPCGDAAALGDALLSITPTLNEVSKRAVREHFDAELSTRAIGMKLAAAYDALLHAKHARERGHR